MTKLCGMSVSEPPKPKVKKNSNTHSASGNVADLLARLRPETLNDTVILVNFNVGRRSGGTYTYTLFLQGPHGRSCAAGLGISLGILPTLFTDPGSNQGGLELTVQKHYQTSQVENINMKPSHQQKSKSVGVRFEAIYNHCDIIPTCICIYRVYRGLKYQYWPLRWTCQSEPMLSVPAY